MYDTDHDRMLSVTETAEFLGMNDQHTRELFRKRILPGVKLGRVYRIAQSDLSAYLSSLKAKAGVA